MKIIFYAMIAMSFMANGTAFARDPSDIKKAMNILAGENVIAEKHSDAAYGARPTELAWAFSTIAKSNKASELFQKLAQGGSFYGLIGLAALDKEKFDKETLHFKGSSVVIVVDQDFSQEFEAEIFIRDKLGKEPKKWYNRLIFDIIPPWKDTVKISSPLSHKKK